VESEFVIFIIFTAKLAQHKLLVFCENALANSTLLCFRKTILQKKAGLLSQTTLPS
jgi:hypothetical protein